MAMKDLAYTSKDMEEQKEKYAPMPAEYDGPKYPYGLNLSLDKHCLDKLGMKATDFAVGEELQVPVRLKVSNVAVNETVEGGRSENVGLTVVAMDFGKGADETERAEKLYGKKEK